MILDLILATKSEEVAELKKKISLAALQEKISRMEPCRDFRTAISINSCAVIAEVKGASPSRGRLVKNFHPVEIAEIYEKNGAAAISVLTDGKYFAGKNEYLTQIRHKVCLPLLRKDFIIDTRQIYETRALGADAVLLIAAVLKDKLGEFIAIAAGLGLQQLVEVHTHSELRDALAAGAEIIGINNRNLTNFVTDINACRNLAPFIPPDRIAVAESGISRRKDIETLLNAGIHVFLIGEALVTANDIGKKLRALRGS
ncbi:MAG TPA: indole-3-glycerol phosphate synthase TrpC [Smithellaceae bacterium]|nr:indole-3-glycerol phosphate synthase TrpC [Smithellaceae bacterium]